MNLRLALLASGVLFCSFVESQENFHSDLDLYLNERGFYLSPTHTLRNEGYSSANQRMIFYQDLQKLPQVQNIMEIGFNGGHSSEVFLNSKSCQKLVSFDINVHPYTKVGVEFMKSKFGNRFEFVEGDSMVEVPKYGLSHPNETFDLIFIDGSHTFESCVSDIRNCQKLAHKDTFLWIDDYNEIHTVKTAVNFCVELGLITLLESKSINDHGKEQRSWVIAQYLSECERIFSDIYKKGLWGKDKYGQAISGPGSTLEQGKPFIKYVQEVLNQTPNIQSVVDVGCGDWVLGREINWGEREYLGIDTVKTLILKNQSMFGSDKIHFVYSDATTSDLPSGDLVICKDVFIHWSNKCIADFLLKLKNFKYCILVNDVSSTKGNSNVDIKVGEFRPIDLTSSPFFLTPKETSYYFSGSALKQILLIENKNI